MYYISECCARGFWKDDLIWDCQLEYSVCLPKHDGLCVVLFTLHMEHLNGCQLPVNEGNSIFQENFDNVSDIFIDTLRDAIGI